LTRVPQHVPPDQGQADAGQPPVGLAVVVPLQLLECPLADEDQGTAAPTPVELRDLEKTARFIRAYELRFVPELLQTEEYVRAVILQSAPAFISLTVGRRRDNQTVRLN
jgi:hypothetical protein